MAAWLAALTAPIRETLYPKFKAWEARCWYDLKHQSGQVAYLEFVLNERFDAAQKRIWIGPGNLDDVRVYIYRDDENQPLYIYQDSELQPLTYLYTDDEISGAAASNYDFTINIPAGLPHELATIRAVADRYAREGKTYKIVFF